MAKKQHTAREEQKAMIREAAYFHYIERGYAPGHDLDDWLAAEAELERIASERPTSEFTEFPSDTEMQQSSIHGARKDDELKRIVKRHPQKGIPQIESVSPKKAPFKE